MKTRRPLLFAPALLVLLLLNHPLSTAFAQNTTFTYQGRVTDYGTNFTGAVNGSVPIFVAFVSRRAG